MIVKANELHPYHQGVMYYRGVAAALTNRPAEGVNFLREAVLVNAKFDLSIEPLLCLSGQEEFESLKLLQKELLQPVIHSDTAFIIEDRTIHLETVTAGEKEGVFYLASIHKRKIIRVDKGNVTDLLKVETHSSIAILSI